LRAKTETEKRLASAETLQLDANRLEWDHEIRQSNQMAKLERIRNDLARLQSDILTSERILKRLGYEEHQHQVLAPIEGSVGEVANLQVGAYVRQGDRIASIIPKGNRKQSHSLNQARPWVGWLLVSRPECAWTDFPRYNMECSQPRYPAFPVKYVANSCEWSLN